jgi:2-dehydro-3-deoxygluconokinase
MAAAEDSRTFETVEASRLGPEVVTLGECLVALVAADEAPLADATAFSRHVAGAEANVAVTLARLGRRSAFIGRVGADPFGTAIVRRLRGEGVDVSHVTTVTDRPTGVLVRDRRTFGASEVLYLRSGSAGATLDRADVIRAVGHGLFRDAVWLHLTGVTAALGEGPRVALQAAGAAARDVGVGISFDVNLRRKLWSPTEAAPVLRTLAAAADLVFGSVDELALLVGGGNAADRPGLEGLLDAVLALGPRTVVVKLGRDGAFARGRGADGSVWTEVHPGFPAWAPIDPIGAGDAFVGGYITARVEGLTPRDALALGNACGASAACAVGDLTGLPSRAEAQAMIDGGSPDTRR